MTCPPPFIQRILYIAAWLFASMLSALPAYAVLLLLGGRGNIVSALFPLAIVVLALIRTYRWFGHGRPQIPDQFLGWPWRAVAFGVLIYLLSFVVGFLPFLGTGVVRVYIFFVLAGMGAVAGGGALVWTEIADLRVPHPPVSARRKAIYWGLVVLIALYFVLSFLGRLLLFLSIAH
jgi:hypothetical protein